VSETAETEWSDVELHCLEGGRAPARLIEHWRVYQGLPPQVRARIWELIFPVFDQSAGPELDQHAQKFAASAGCSEAAAQQSLDVCRFVTSRAISMNLPLETFRADLQALSGATPGGVEELASQYEDIGSIRRAEIIQASLLDHGRLLTDVRWRVDTVAASSRASGIATPIVHLTLAYQEGHGTEAERGHITLQVLPEATAQLRSLCDQLDAALARTAGGNR
jgi:hypothetical protein